MTKTTVELLFRRFVNSSQSESWLFSEGLNAILKSTFPEAYDDDNGTVYFVRICSEPFITYKVMAHNQKTRLTKVEGNPTGYKDSKEAIEVAVELATAAPKGLLGYQIADDYGENIQGDAGYTKYSHNQILSIELASKYLEELCNRDGKRYTLKPIFHHDITNPGFVK